MLQCLMEKVSLQLRGAATGSGKVYDGTFVSAGVLLVCVRCALQCQLKMLNLN